MQGSEILLMILLIGVRQPSNKAQDTSVDSEPAEIRVEPTPEPAPLPSADLKPSL